MMKALMRRARPLLRGLRSYVIGWRGAVLAGLALALVLAVDAIDVPSAINVVAALSVVGALTVLLSSAARSGAAVSAVPESRQASKADATRPEPGELPSVSLIITAYNDERFVRSCLDTATAQRYPDLEIIVVDDAGTDGTAGIVREVMANDSRISLLRHEKNLGLAAARNTGIAAARGEYITFLDADDFLIKQSIRSRARRLARASDPRIAGAYCGWELVPEHAATDVDVADGASRTKITFLEAAGENPFIATAPMLKRSVAEAVGGFDESLLTGEDFDFWMRILRQGYQFAGTGSVGVAYRQKRGGMVAEGPARHAASARKVYEYLSRSMFAQEVAAGAPAPFDQPLDAYDRDRRWGLRVAQFVTFAQFGGETGAADELLEMLPPTTRMDVLEHKKGLSKRLDSSMRRLRMRDPEMSDAAADRLRSRALVAVESAVAEREQHRPVDLERGAEERLRRGTYDQPACAARASRVTAAPARSGHRVVLWQAGAPALDDVTAGDSGGVLILCMGPEVVLSDETRTALETRWKKLQILQSRRSTDLPSLAALASLVLEGAAPGDVSVDRFSSGEPTGSEEEAVIAMTAPLPSGSGGAPVVVVPIDQAGQDVDARAYRESTDQDARLVHLGPLSDALRANDMENAFEFTGEVGALAVVYPYGPMVSALIDGARSLGIPTYEVNAAETVDRVDEGGAAGVDGSVSDLEMADRPRAWQTLVSDLRKPWRALNVGDQRRTQKAAAIVKRSEVAKFKDRHAGERCVVIGNGPSLNKLDLKAIANETTFGVNSIYLADEQMGFVPTYYMVEDTMVMKENVHDILAYPVEQKFFPSRYAEHFGADPEGVTFFEMDGSFYSEGSAVFGVPRFSDDYAMRGYCGQSVTILNLQLAFHMGFAEVYLIGMDFSYTIPDSALRDGNHITSTEDDPNHFHPKYFGAGKTWKDPKLDRVLASYQMAKRVYEQHGREIINATAGGALELFRRADYHDVFGGVAPAGEDD